MTDDIKNKNSAHFEKPDFFGPSGVRLGEKRRIILTICSLVLIIFAAAVLAGFSRPPARPDDPVEYAIGRDILRIDGNRNGKYVDFDHEAHKAITGSDGTGCRTCHHLSRPHDGPSLCCQCHRDMEKVTSVFDHNYHAKIHPKNSCRECHTGNKEQEIKPCGICHEEYIKDIQYYLKVPGYKHALHDSCIGCHEKQDEKMGEVILGDCGFCHKDDNNQAYQNSQ